MSYGRNRSILCSLAIACVTAVSVEAQETGRVAAILGTVQIARGGMSQMASIGAPVFDGDRLTTGSTDQAKVVFEDDSVIDLGPGTDVLLAKQVFERTSHRLGSLLRLSNGKLRAWVGEAYRGARSRYEVETPTAITTVRGTEFIVAYDSAAEVTKVICITGELEVAGTLGVIGGRVQLAAQSGTEVAKGRFPSPPERVGEAPMRQYLAGLELVGTGHRDGLSVAHPALSGQPLTAQDVPGVPPKAGAAEGLTVRGLQESLADRLSPDVRANTQPLLDFKLTPPDHVPTGNVNVQF
jgi:hypothetical protein